METDRDKKNPLRGRGAISAAGGDLSEFGRTEHSLHYLWFCLKGGMSPCLFHKGLIYANEGLSVHVVVTLHVSLGHRLNGSDGLDSIR